ncbi:MAG: hypothetical protein ABUK11_02115 [Mariprofundaceae bacterium]
MYHKSKSERGFILVTSILLLSILTILGAVSFFKSNVEIKISVGSAQSEQAFSAAQAGLDYTYYYWKQNSSGKTEFKNLGKLVTAGSPNVSLLVNKHVDEISDIPTVLVDIDGWVRASNARVYTLTSGMMTKESNNGSWNNTTNKNRQQVAVWAADYKKPSSLDDYPYGDHQSSVGTCSECVVVVYALGRSGNSYRLLREYMSTTDRIIQTFGALTDAPKYKDRSDWCANSLTAHSAADSPSLTSIATGLHTDTHMIEATQAPGGTAVAANGEVQTFSGAGKPWNNSRKSSGVAFDNNPYIVYDPGKVAVAGYSAIAKGYMDDVQSSAVAADKFGSGYMDYFQNASSQLFQLDAYREAANRISGFDTEMIGSYKVNTGGGAAVGASPGTPLGNYTALKTGNGNHGRMGTLQWADVEYNIINAKPMYGLVRMLVPAVRESHKDGKTDDEKKRKDIDCNGDGDYTDAVDVLGFKASFSYNNSSGKSDLSAVSGAKLIVYGAGLVDFFYDDGDGIYEPASERLLTPQEALTFKVDVEIPLMFNPAMDGLNHKTGSSDTSYTDITSYPNGAPSWNQSTDELTNGDGVMDLIWDVWNTGKTWSGTVSAGWTYQNWMSKKPDGSTDWPAGWTDKLDAMLEYYFKTSAAASKATYSSSSFSGVESNPDKFYINTDNDLVANKASWADLFHTFLPSGYVHGWKRAFAETGLGAASGTGTIWSEKLILTGSDYFNERTKYFYVTRNSDGEVHIDKDFADLPAEMYAGGLVDMHEASNVSGAVYSQGQLELEQKSATAHQYINGIVISGYGTYLEYASVKVNATDVDGNELLDDKGKNIKVETPLNAKTIIAYDSVSTDNLPTSRSSISLGRKYWQELK